MCLSAFAWCPFVGSASVLATAASPSLLCFEKIYNNSGLWLTEAWHTAVLRCSFQSREETASVDRFTLSLPSNSNSMAPIETTVTLSTTISSYLCPS